MKDCVGNDVHLDAILKVYHFTGARRRKHFMYKQVGETVGDLVKIHHLPIGTIQDDYYLVKESEALTDSGGCRLSL